MQKIEITNEMNHNFEIDQSNSLELKLLTLQTKNKLL